MEEPPVATSEALSAAGDEPPLATPHGLDEIIALFGNISEYIGEDGKLEKRWQLEFLAKVILPYPLRLSWDPSRTITQMTCHRRMTRVFTSVFGRIHECGLSTRITSFGGCFAFCRQRTSKKLSTHGWGIAIDLNPETNLQGAVGGMDAVVIEIFRRAGFEWGGDWRGKTRDPMHFQFCTGY